ncbi:MAG: hypothetical protein ABR540_10000 [Acidimicrobiales bacterium]|nr:hypothetical protein [Actinomycetota bacterium]
MAPETEPGTPQAAALEWVEAVMERRDLAAAWPLTDATLRLVLAQDWVWNHRHDLEAGSDHEWDAIGRGLAECPSTHALWERFAQDTVTHWQTIWKGFTPRTWSVSEAPEVLDLDWEMVTFVETGEPGAQADAVPATVTAFTRRFAMLHTDDGWRVASINGHQMFRPGWPPTLGQQAGHQ